ncbi:NADH dehydrogenase (ubiquinone) complex I, assembly factor 6 [Trichinella pseudospiralis]|uniref:15-cis-phytoene synthase n=2 Tax=Trichinella pseudospiralis TaxID=6337 RepID=A0A0V1E1H1_TRIPS|nr:NADH dehydrogenase (ubiquinone) complex I, assembly factor 6 [Trichinella pseudospiralis]KRY82956.1 NADH dehydrogenase (ubiquinone) complex I, assembly factor 6 [Trichinella pseudospiralis]KRZ11853.1 NADH dehydrogenase (ubiquinone) complex I, assembly factor 6 [Trichinella pseudospiralis]
MFALVNCLHLMNNVHGCWSSVHLCRFLSWKLNKYENPYYYCMSLVRQSDFESFLCTSTMPAKYKLAVFSIQAFNVELAGIPARCSSKQSRHGRIEFWKEVVHGIYKGNVPEHPVAVTLASSVLKYKLSKRWLLDLVEARRYWLGAEEYRSLRIMEDYFDRTFSTVLYLILQICNVEQSEAIRAAGHLGKALGLVNSIRSIPHLAAERKILLPLDLLKLHNFTEFGGQFEDSSKWTTVIRDIADHADRHVAEARKLTKPILKQAYPALLYAVVVDHHLAVLRRYNYDVFNAETRRTSPLLVLNLCKQRLFQFF